MLHPRIARFVLPATCSALLAAAGVIGPVASATPASAAIASIGLRAEAQAASRKGAPYQWGAVGPRKFDCSGLTLWSYARVGKRLPRTTTQQYRATLHVSRSQARVGDLVFFHNRSGIYHVAIYAGRNMIWHAPKPGRRVSLVPIWTSSVYFGRVR